MRTDDEELVQQLMQIESELNKSLEEEDFERMNMLLEQREMLLKELKSIPEPLATSILESDKIRMEKIKNLMENIKNQALQTRTSQSALRSYSPRQEETHSFDDRK